jgi:RimJ/RimL family protein N-acetyltransferase
LLPSGYPNECIETVFLKDGTQVLLRPIRPDDAPRLQEGFARLSPQTIYLRFLQTFKELTDEQARQFATVDYQQRMALVGSVQEEGEERLIAVARYSMVGEDHPGIAEAGIVVRDDYQNRGLGTIALERLVRYGRLHGVTGLLATIHMSNTRILHFIQRSGLPFDKKMLEPGTWEILVKLDAVDEPV